MPTKSEISIERLTTFEEFKKLEHEWGETSANHVNTIFLSYLWLQEWWHVYGTDYRIWTLVARKEGRMIGVMPLILSNDIFGIRRLMFMGAGEITPNHLDIIASPQEYDEVFQAFIAYLHQMGSEWDVLELDKFPGDDTSVDLLTGIFQTSKIAIQTDISAICPYVELPGSFEQYLASRGSTTRESYRRAKRKLEKDHPNIRFSLAGTPEEVKRVMDALIRLHQKRWLQKGYSGAFSNPDFIDFHRTVALQALQSHHLRLYYLHVDDEIIAVYYCYRIAESVQFYLGAFDETYSKYSPGILINGFAIEQSILEGARTFDFLEGEERYKQYWMTNSRENIIVYAFRPNFRGQIARVNRGIRMIVIDAARRFLSQEVRLSVRRVLQRLHISI